MDHYSVPFSYTFWGANLSTHTRVQGVLAIDPAGVTIEYRETRTPTGTVRPEVLEGDTRGVTIPWRELRALTFRHPFFGRRHIRMRAFRMSSFQSLPGVQGDEIRLGITRTDENAARDLLAHAALLHAERELRRIESTGTSALPPA